MQMGESKSKNFLAVQNMLHYTYIPSGTPTNVYTLDLNAVNVTSTMVMGMGWSCVKTHLNLG